MKSDKVTVIIPVYNAGNFLKPAIDSILNQSFRNLEIIIVNDGSTDGCVEKLKPFTDPRVILIEQENQGKPAAVNNAFKLTTGKYWTLQDADDISYPNRIESQYDALESEGDLAAVFIGNDLIINGQTIAPRIKGKSREECAKLIENQLIPAHDAVGMYRTSMTKDTRYDPELKICEGVDLILRIGEKLPMKVIDGCHYSHRVNPDSITHSDPNRNIRYNNLLIRKTCERRKIDPSSRYIKEKKPSRLFRHRQVDTIVSYCMESVRQHKRVGLHYSAFKTAIKCAAIHPLDPLYYKPILRFLSPEKLIDSLKKKT